MMNLSSDTPPDGDFAAYVDRLTGGQCGTQPREALFASRGQAPAGTAPQAEAQTLSLKTIAKALGGIPFHKHLLWLVAVWFAAQALEQVMPQAAFLFWPVLLVDLGWLAFRINRNTAGALARSVIELARQAEEVRKSRLSRRNHL